MKQNNGVIKKFFNKWFWIIEFTILLSLSIILVVLIFTVEYNLISTIFYGFLVLFLSPLIYYWLNSKSISSKIRKKKFNIRNDHKNLIDRFYVNAEYNLANYHSAFIRSKYWTSIILVTPIIYCIFIAIVFAAI